jgi:hypothetical protein
MEEPGVNASDLPKHRLVVGDERYSPKSAMRAYPIVSYKLIAGARRVPVSSTILVTPTNRASRSRASTSARPIPGRGRFHVHSLEFGGRFVQPPYGAAADATSSR